MMKLGIIGHRKLNDSMRLIVSVSVGILFGFLIGTMFPVISDTKIQFPSGIFWYNGNTNSSITTETLSDHDLTSAQNINSSSSITTETLSDHDLTSAQSINSSSLNSNNSAKIQSPSGIFWYNGDTNSNVSTETLSDHDLTSPQSINSSSLNSNSSAKNYVPTNPRGEERLPPGIIESESDLYLRRLCDEPNEDLPIKQKYLVIFTVGYDMKTNIDAAVKKFSENFTILLFHYLDGRTSDWDEFEWSKRAIHVSAKKQTKWWYAKRFLHPDIVAAYEYIFIWDEDLGVEHFNGETYIELVKKHGLEISQPALGANKGLTWKMTKRRGGKDIHKTAEEKKGWCSDPHDPPCAGFIEIMAPVFSRDAWRCVWHMIQNDLVHGWGLDFALRRCVEPAHEKIGVVDAQWIVHQGVPSLGNQGVAQNGKTPQQGVKDRCRKEWETFQLRMADAEKEYYKKMGMTPPKTTIVS